jgi:hypothetical protein
MSKRQGLTLRGSKSRVAAAPPKAAAPKPAKGRSLMQKVRDRPKDLMNEIDRQTRGK